ncbi:GTPase [Exiguobacterium profundum]
MLNINIGLFLAHLIVTDNKIDIKTNRILIDFLKSEGDICSEEFQEINNIIENNDNAQPLSQALKRLNDNGSTHDKETALSIGLTLCLHKGFLTASEIKFFENSRKTLGVSKKTFFQLKKEIERGIDETAIANLALERKQNELKQFGYILPLNKLINKYEIDEHAIKKSEAMMKDRAYSSAISFNKKIGKSDIKFAEPIIREHIKELHNLQTNVNLLTSELKNVKNKELETTKSLIEASENLQSQIYDVVKQREDSIDMFLKKIENSADYFTISFLGKTKAGKSTLHAVLSGKGKEAIGVGRQRTTRNNRVYSWEGLRVIDTPGIGAPHGQSDEDIAKSILDESDLICYVLKNDSIQEKEFEFLSMIKERNKPIVILLNIKSNLSTPARLRKFLRNPDDIYERKDEKSIEGHLNRIRTYARKHYSNDIFDIIPVHLYAALLSQDTTNSEDERRILFDGSRLAQFENTIKQSIVSEGYIRKSQTILNGCLNPLIESEKLIHHHLNLFKSINEDFNKFQQDSTKKFDYLKEKYCKQIERTIDKEFLKIEEEISHFSNSNYGKSKGIIESKWKSLLKDIGFEDGLNNSLEKIQLEYNEEVQEYLSEMIENMKFADLLLQQKISKSSPGVFDFRRMFGYLSAGLGVASAVALFFSGPWGWGLAAVSMLTGLVKFLFKSKKQKIQEAISSLSSSLKKGTKQQKENMKKQAIDSFLSRHAQISRETNDFQQGMISTLNSTIDILSRSLNSIKMQQDSLNKAYAYRLMRALMNNRKPVNLTLNEHNIDELIDKVERDFGKEIVIYTQKQVDTSKLEYISKVIQENIKVYSIQT